MAVVLTASAGCGESKLPEETGTVQETQTYSSQEEPSRTAEPAQTEEESPVPEADFESLAALLGMEDAETAWYKVAMIVSIALVYLITFLILRASNKLYKLLGETGSNVMMRLMGLILMVIAVECMISGLKPVLSSIISMA